MWNEMSRTRWLGAWSAAVLVIGACVVVADPTVTVFNAATWLAIAAVPLLVLMAVWRGAPPKTVAELLNAVEELPQEGP